MNRGWSGERSSTGANAPGAEQALRGMGPAQHRLHGQRRTRGEVDDRLVVQVELVVPDRRVQFGVEHDRGGAAELVHGWVVELEVDVLGARLVEGDRGLAEQFRAASDRRDRVRRAGGGAERHVRGPGLGGAELDRPCNRAQKRQRAAPHMRGIIGDRQINTEVVRADVSDVFAVLGRFPQSSPGTSQQVLGDVMPKSAQDVSISGEVEHDQRSRIRVLTGPESFLDIIDEHLPGGQRGQPIVRGQISLSSMDPSISHCGPGVCCETMQRLLFELTETKVRGPTDEPGTQPPRLGAVVRRHRHVGNDPSGQSRRVRRIAAPGLPAADVPMQQGRNIVVRGQLDLHDVHVRERTGVLGSAPQNPRLIKVFGQPPNRSSMPLPRLPLLTLRVVGPHMLDADKRAAASTATIAQAP